MRVVVALGGNALGPTVGPRYGAGVVRHAAAALAELVVDGYQLIITHGNGPQVGELMLDQEARGTGRADPLPLDVLVAMTQAQLGYVLQQELEDELVARGDRTDVVTIVTEVIVDAHDPELESPTKPVGPWYDVRPDDGRPYVEDAGGRWRRVVPSPRPQEVVERKALRAIVDDGIVPICGGGGGVPVVREGLRLRGIEAVIDKDLTSALLASELDAQALVILTDVGRVERGHGGPAPEPIDLLPLEEAEALLPELPAGSMRPKVEAAMIAAREGRRAVIGSLSEALAVARGAAGTRVVAT